jgi:RNA polymerase sigma factor (sigma-70 family)
MAMPPLGAVLQQLRRMIRPPSVAGLSDGQLLVRFLRQRDEEAFAVLVERYGPLVLGVCRRVLPEGHDAEDAFQATFLVLVRKAASLNRTESLANWLYTVAYRLSLKARGQCARRRARELEVGTMRPNQVSEVGETADVLPILDEELHALPEKYRAPLLLCYLQGKTNVEAARELGWRPGSMSRRLSRGRELLRQRLLKRGVALSAAGLAVFLTQQATATVPAALLAATMRAGLQTAAGVALTVTVSGRVAALVEGTVKDMFLAKLKGVAALLLVLGLAGAGVAFRPAPPAEPPATPAPAKASGERDVPRAPEEPVEKALTDLQGDELPAGALMRLGTVRLRHGGPVNSVAFSPDGKTAATGGGQSDNVIRLWDTATSREVRSFKGHTANINGLAFTPDGKQIISCAMDQTVRLWDVASGAEVRQFRGHEAGVKALALAPDGKTAATSSDDQTVRLWDVATGTEQRSFALGNVGHGVAFAADGKTLAAAVEGGSVVLWETSTGKELFNQSAHNGAALCVAFSPDGKTLATGGREKTVRLWDVSSGKQVRSFESTSNVVQALAFAADGKALAVGVQAKPILVVDPASGKELRPFVGGSYGIRSVAFSPDSQTLLTGGGNHSAYLWDVATGKERFPYPGHNYAGSVSFAPDGKTVRVGYQDQVVRVWDLAGKERHFILGTGFYRGKAAAFSPDGRLMAVGGAAGTGSAIRLFDLDIFKKVHERKNETPIHALAWSADGKALAVGGQDGSVRVVDANSFQVLHDLGKMEEGAVWTLELSPDGKLLAAAEGAEGRRAAAGRTVRLWDLTSGKERPRLTGPQAPIESIAFSPDGRWVAAGPRGTNVWVWDARTGDVVAELRGHTTWIYTVQFSPDSRTLASGSLDNTIRLWETTTWKERSRLEGHRGAVVSLAFAADGRTLASGSADSSVLVWDLTGRWRDGRLAPARLTAPELEIAWSELSAPDAAKAHRSLWLLAAAPEQALPLLREALRPIVSVSAERLKRLIAQLDDDDFTVREAASAELAKLGGAADEALRKALEGQPSAELRQRVQHLLDGARKTEPSPEQLREARAVELLEGMGTPEARRLLEELAKGAPGARLTTDARAALERSGKRQAK